MTKYVSEADLIESLSGERIVTDALTRCGISQKELARAIGVSNDCITRYRTGFISAMGQKRIAAFVENHSR